MEHVNNVESLSENLTETVVDLKLNVKMISSCTEMEIATDVLPIQFLMLLKQHVSGNLVQIIRLLIKMETVKTVHSTPLHH